MSAWTVAPTLRLVVVNRRTYRLDVWARRPLRPYRRIRRYEIAIGKRGYSTPSGVFPVLAKAKDPVWLPPDEPWVGPELRDEHGRPVPMSHDDPRHPIRERFLKLTEDGIGIHGTLALESLGTQASHGCIRLRPAEVIDLYALVPVNTPVVIA